MRMRKGVSPVIATLLLILIAVAAAVLLYTWVSGLSANVAGTQVTGKTLTLIQATWAMPYNGTGTANAANFDVNDAVLILSFKAPPAAVGGAGSGKVGVTLDNADVLYAGRVICHYDSWAMSTDDAFHTGQRVGNANPAYGMVLMGYVGTNVNVYDPGYDLRVPGGIVLGLNDTAGHAAANYVKEGGTVKNEVAIPQGDSWATVVAGTWEVNYVSTNYVETYFKPTNAIIRYDRFANQYLNYDATTGALTTSNTATGTSVPLYDNVKVSQDDFAVVIWCKNINMNVMNSVDVRLQFQDGSTWTTSVPLAVQ